MEEKHKRTIPGYNNMEDLANDIGDLHYEELAKFLFNLSQKIKSDGFKDLKRGRQKLSTSLLESSYHLNKAGYQIDKSWIISKPYME